MCWGRESFPESSKEQNSDLPGSVPSTSLNSPCCDLLCSTGLSSRLTWLFDGACLECVGLCGHICYWLALHVWPFHIIVPQTAQCHHYHIASAQHLTCCLTQRWFKVSGVLSVVVVYTCNLKTQDFEVGRWRVQVSEGSASQSL